MVQEDSGGEQGDVDEMEREYTQEGVDRRVGTDLYGWEDDADYHEGLPKNWFSMKKLWLFCGPGFLMSIAFLVRQFACVLLLSQPWPVMNEHACLL